MKRNTLMLVFLLIVSLFVLTACGGPESTYKKAQSLLSEGKYAEASEKFESIGSYEDAIKLAMYCKACALCEEGNYETGIAGLETLGDYKDCNMRIAYYTARSWDDSSAGTTEFEWMERAKSIYKDNPLYLDSTNRINTLDTRIAAAKKILYDEAVISASNGQYDVAIALFERLENYNDSMKRAIYYNILKDEIALIESTDHNALIAIAARYEEMGKYLDCVDRAASVESKTTAILNSKYDAAMKLMNEGSYIEAYGSFTLLNGYKDSNEKATQAKMFEIEEATIGSYITLGSYEQDNSTDNGKEVIEWLVLEKTENRILVISRYALDGYYFHYDPCMWTYSVIRKWLNSDFFNTAFNSLEQSLIDVGGTADIKEDRVFLLSTKEAKDFFSSDNDRKCMITTYAKEKVDYDDIKDGFCWWWLRSTVSWSEKAVVVQHDGSIYEEGYRIETAGKSPIRPALWIKLEP